MNETFVGAATMTSRLRVVARKARSAKRLATLAIYRLCSKSDFTWRYVANLRPWLEYQQIQKSLNDIQRQLLADLKRNGIVVTSVRDLLGTTTLFEELDAAAWSYEASLADEIQRNRLKINTPTPGRGKSYVFTLLGPIPTLDANDIFVRFALQPELLSIVNGYYGMLTKLRYYNVWHNFPTNEEPREAQLWHRDPEDRAILKIFVYLTDVDEGKGPLCYVPGTHAFGAVKIKPGSRLFKEGRSMVRRTDDDQMNAVVPKEQWIAGLGPKGTVVFVDTRGYHKGGFVRDGERILYTCMFASQAATSPELFRRQYPIPSHIDPSVAFAIGI